MGWNYKRTHHGKFGTVPFTELKKKCPCCKKITKFKRIDVNSDDGMVFCEGEYMPLYRCNKCWIIIGAGSRNDDANSEAGEQ